ncbi:hypothetical protein [Aureimonas sp. AU40]|uniref:hypothetical protein n=1 Tax=Aureimonas sp. AU40 TaxID=1637747 RepID=UPI000783FF8F|nr:hypothetical protein [Aureimonas sp. AU40]
MARPELIDRLKDATHNASPETAALMREAVDKLEFYEDAMKMTEAYLVRQERRASIRLVRQ